MALVALDALASPLSVDWRTGEDPRGKTIGEGARGGRPPPERGVGTLSCLPVGESVREAAAVGSDAESGNNGVVQRKF